MNSAHAFCFLLSGLGMWLLPAAVPNLFVRTGIDGASAREMWIQVMAAVNAGVGIVGLVQHAVLPWLMAWYAAARAVAAAAGAGPCGGGRRFRRGHLAVRAGCLVRPRPA